MAILFGFLLAIFTAALIRGVTGAATTTGRVAAAVFCAALILAVGWASAARRLARVEISKDAIRFVSRNGKPSALSRQSGDELRFVKQHAGPMSRIWTLGLSIAGTDAVLLLSGFFSRSEVRKACRVQGWRVDN